LGVGQSDAVGQVAQAFACNGGVGDPKTHAIQQEVDAEPNERSPLDGQGGFGKQQNGDDRLKGRDQHEQFSIVEHPKNRVRFF
jgi:hypothetical protein